MTETDKALKASRRGWAERIAAQFETDSDAIDAIEEGIARGMLLARIQPADDAVEPPKWTSAVPMVRTERGTWSKVHYEPDGAVGRDVTADEADAIGAWQFHMLKPRSPLAITALASPQGEKGE